MNSLELGEPEPSISATASPQSLKAKIQHNSGRYRVTAEDLRDAKKSWSAYAILARKALGNWLWRNA